jgi:hypothetical protein
MAEPPEPAERNIEVDEVGFVTSPSLVENEKARGTDLSRPTTMTLSSRTTCTHNFRVPLSGIC